MATDRRYDLVLYGATGFTGRLTAEYLARHAPPGCRWALAGRSRDRLAALRERLAGIAPSCGGLALLVADAGDPDTMLEVAAAARVVASVTGPYLAHGEPMVAACAAAGTDYLDITGEPEFVDLMYLRYHEQAVRTGARLVHACGFDSIPHDLGVLFTVRQLPAGRPVRIDGDVRIGGAPSGGTVASALLAFSRLGAMARASRRRRDAEPRPPDRRVRSGPGRPGRSRSDSAWALPFPGIDAQIVGRSAAALPAYGPDFRYRHRVAVGTLPAAAGVAAAAALLLGAAQLPPLRRALLARRPPGDGPDEARRARSEFRVRFTGRAGDAVVRTEVSGGDPGYGETAKMFGESALCLAFDDLPPATGQLTTAVAMGTTLIDRLTAAGLRFAVLGTAETRSPVW